MIITILNARQGMGALAPEAPQRGEDLKGLADDDTVECRSTAPASYGRYVSRLHKT